MNPQYRLKKDLPNIKAGEIFAMISMFESPDKYIGIPNKISIPLKDIDNFDEWFEPYEERWQPKIGDKYWGFDLWGRIGKNEWHENTIGQKEMWEMGNCFQTKEGAECCLENFIKPAFKKYHKLQKSNAAEC